MIARELSQLVMDDLERRNGILDDVDIATQEEMRRELAVKMEAKLKEIMDLDDNRATHGS